MKNQSENSQHLKWMRLAIKLSEQNLISQNGGPFGAIILRDDKIIAQEANSVTETNDPTAHAEVNAIRAACAKIGSPNLEGCIMYTSCEPCPMCTSAIYWSNIKTVYYGNTKTDAEWAGFGDTFITEELAKPIKNRTIAFERVGGSEALKAFEQWVELSKPQKENIKNGTL